ncbi:hypothetical protein H6P81_011328 [Aristolochia fimbriata]|uniref:Fucosyltransferase n=1 Tax=Aristolochia fimbriata TaxID=158543 RepID=A0AAV7ERN0_ARIFI|nr:hypothetical protein H6P81_011328 [Aristolochia fimbriata]
MDMKRFRKQLSQSTSADPENEGLSRAAERKSGLSMSKLIGVLAACLMLLPILLTVSVLSQSPPSNRIRNVAERLDVQVKAGQDQIRGVASGRPLEDKQADLPVDKLLDGLLAVGFDENSCLSRYQSVLFRKASPHKPSKYLLEKLRKYEMLHKKCGPNTESYSKTLEQLKNGQNSGSTDCNYIVWIAFSGLGNRIVTLASVFLYALLTEKVLLIDRGTDMAHLFCEPFPESSWLLPMDFPLIDQFKSFDIKSPKSFGNMLKNDILDDSMSNVSVKPLPVFSYLHLAHDYGDYDKLFFCEQDQLLLQRIPWLILRSDNYFVPSLFLIPMFEQELAKLFPQKDTVFHHLGRYLFHPSNPVWGLITRYYQAYLAKADERIGVQIRVFEVESGPFQHVLDQILGCSLHEKLLPGVTSQVPEMNIIGNAKTKAVLLTSLSPGYYEKIRDMYWEQPTVNGEIISVFQPSYEGYQQTGKQMHNMKAWAEMYLLSLTDTLITSPWSTFGYVAQGLAGLKPWIMFKPENRTTPDPPCRRSMSMEPCFHAPPFYDCKAKKGIDTGELVPHVRHCEDMSWGLKVVDRSEW